MGESAEFPAGLLVSVIALAERVVGMRWGTYWRRDIVVGSIEGWDGAELLFTVAVKLWTGFGICSEDFGDNK